MNSVLRADDLTMGNNFHMTNDCCHQWLNECNRRTELLQSGDKLLSPPCTLEKNEPELPIINCVH